MRPVVLPLALGVLGVIAGRLGCCFKVWVEPQVPVVKQGGSIVLTLRSNCSDPHGTGDFVDREGMVRKGPGVVELINVSLTDSTVESYYVCNGERPKIFFNLIVYRDPGPVTLEPVPWLPVGANHELVCRVDNVLPVRNLVVTLLRDSEPLQEKTFKTHEESGPKTIWVSHKLQVRRQDHGHNVSCQALLDLEPLSPQPRSSSQPQPLLVYEFPEDPQLEPDIHLETGERLNTSCSVSGAFPAPRFALTLANRSLPLSISRDGLRATATLSNPVPGNLTLLCTVTVGPQQRCSESTVHVYSVPSLWFNVSSSNVVTGATVTGRCLLPPGYSDRSWLRLQAGHRILAGWQRAPLAFNLTLSQEDDGLELSCEARLSVGQKNLTRSQRIQLRVSGAHDLLLLVLVPTVVVATLVATGYLGYRLYYRHKKIRFYQLQRQQQQHLQLAPTGPPGTSQGAAAAPAAPNGSA